MLKLILDQENILKPKGICGLEEVNLGQSPSNIRHFTGAQFSAVAQACLTLWDCNMSGFPVHQQLLELSQTHVHWVGDTIQPSHPLLPPSPPALNLSWHWGLFQWVGCLQQVAKYWSFSFSPSIDYSGLSPLGLTCWISLQSKGLSRVFFKTTVQKHQFFSAQPSLWSNSHIHTWLLEKP